MFLSSSRPLARPARVKFLSKTRLHPENPAETCRSGPRPWTRAPEATPRDRLIAQEGGIGIIHKNVTPQAQAAAVQREALRVGVCAIR
jgi:hypothetical protein